MLVKSFCEEIHGLFDHKIRLVVLFILPILTVMMMGIELEEEVISNIPLAVIDQDGTAFSRLLIDAFDQNMTFNVTEYPSNQSQMAALIRDSQVGLGMIIPEGFYEDVATLQSPTVLMVYDGANMAITGTAKAKAMEILLTYKAGAAMQQISGRLGIGQDLALNVANVINFENRVLYNPAKSYEDFLAPILLAGYVQAAIALTASVSINHQIYMKSRRSRAGYGMGKVLFYTVAGLLSFLICISLQVSVFDMPFRGNYWDVVLLTLGLSFAVSAFSVLISSVMRNPMVALIGGGVVFIPNSVMAGTTWPLISMPIGYRGFAAYTPFAHYVNNLRDIYLKGTDLGAFGGSVAYLFVFGGVSLLLVEMVLMIAQREHGEEAIDELSTDVQNTVQVNI